MDAWKRQGKLRGCFALALLLGTLGVGMQPGTVAAGPPPGTVARTGPAPAAAAPESAGPESEAPEGADAAAGDGPDDTTLLDGAVVDPSSADAADPAHWDLTRRAAGAQADDPLATWLTVTGLDRTLFPWLGGPEPREPPLRPLFIPDNKRVDSVARYFLTRKRKGLEAGYRRSTRYLPAIRAIFAEAGIPPKLAYLAAVESNYNPLAHSRARAAGMWQFMSFTARKFGLRVKLPWYDERLDPVYSTRAAARLLAYLHDEYGSWELALAAYNAGEGRVNRAIRRARQPEGEQDYWTLRRLPRETKGYVPAFFALARIYEDPETYGLAHLEQEPPMELEAIEIDVSTSLAELAKLTGVPLAELRRLNPAWKRGFIPPIGIGPVLLHLPAGHGQRVQELLAGNPPPTVAWRVHTVAKGETLSEIARAYGVPIHELTAANPLRNPRKLSIGQVITLPLANGPLANGPPANGSLPTGMAAAPPFESPEADRAEGIAVRTPPPVESAGPKRVKAVHVVQSGDTLWSIAQRYGVDLGDLKRWNGLRGSRLLPDRQLIVFLAR
jgi:membrane-bound lytic murein transglycosylase D